MYPMTAGFSTTPFLTAALLGTSFGGWPLPVNMIFDQYAFICTGDLPATFV
jgi:hypothetical protein